MKKSQKTKEHILNTAKHLFYTQGYQNTTTRQIAEKSQISQSVLFYHFKNKEDILHILVRIYYQNLNAQVLDTDPSLSKMDLLLAYFYVQFFSLYYNRRFKDLILQSEDTVVDILYNDYCKTLFPSLKDTPTPEDQPLIDITIFIASQNAVLRLADKEGLNLGFERLIEILLNLMKSYLALDPASIEKARPKIENTARKIDYSKLNIFSDDFWISL
ncbi:TetR/AcrR family transcriptional regulator [Eubacterium sp. 1001713B170207_170306_E7]|uniref:TetR/AcrR family transcriptional regulator n=1 Tax=Eubacterium sp. 1001713B170207_170306_E7 TaxID=2787097 RepID=UPI0018983097|nr:TetR/AcrR family transcriptional regulator [Eubacterium sp. 1001713B170207_170306_E7]